MSLITDLRDVAYVAILARKALNHFSSNNDFAVEKTWLPYEQLEDLRTNFANGKLYVIAGNRSDMYIRSRKNMGVREYSVQFGFQKFIASIGDVGEIDANDTLLEEIEGVLQTYVLPDLFSFQRVEYLRDNEGLPFSFIQFRKNHVFEAYFTAYYTFVKPAPPAL